MQNITFDEFFDEFKRGDNVDMLRRAIEEGFNINGICYGFTLLLRASTYGRVECIRLLLEHGSDPNVADPMGCSPLMEASPNSAECMRLLIKAGADVHYTKDGFYTPLMRGARSGKLECVQLLLDAGVDPSLTTSTGHTASMLARERGYYKVAEFIDNYISESIKGALEEDEY